MKILLICANGLSTSILMNKMQKWGKEKNIELEVKAVPMSEYLNVYKNFDCILIGPQISYQYNEIKANAIDVPVEKISPMDYGMSNVENIMKQVKACLGKEK
ncbi:PTS sugar transporter subunit IIB [Catenibacterium mitsuokai]|uniref:PTS sugar transporter subunit IIB n=1 Tax=Coprobacillaceae TaxID=2810280 RepID=UPI00192CA79D|nr:MULTISPECIES: PTS sugar transporter subunit IIB [Coprobacillaceae]MBT9813850.1 PTS sugar transporter subunit IIB [Catenibacterium mitsuokai]MCR1948729.1 PTS sugar transporter subunit IIB [Thomasclavelia ramosa]QQY26148.1 PTS sugar transporter subunit IIB [Thomasclavelia ramosa]